MISPHTSTVIATMRTTKVHDERQVRTRTVQRVPQSGGDFPTPLADHVLRSVSGALRGTWDAMRPQYPATW